MAVMLLEIVLVEEVEALDFMAVVLEITLVVLILEMEEVEVLDM